MELFMGNPGLRHIGEKILTNLDFKTELDCRLVQKSWKHIIDEKASKIDAHFLQTFFKQSVTTEEEFMKEKRLRHSNDVTMSRKCPFVDEESYISWRELFGNANSMPNNILINIYLLNVVKSMIKTQKNLNSPIREFFERRNIKMVEVILNQRMADYFHFQDIVEKAIRAGCIEMIKIMHPLFDFSFFFVSIQLSIYYGKLNILEFLLTENPKASLVIENNEFNTNNINIIKSAIEFGGLQSVKMLCQKVNNPIVTDKKGNSPIYYAAAYGQLEILKFLTTYSRNLNVPNKNGMTPLKIATSNGHKKIVQYLQELLSQ